MPWGILKLCIAALALAGMLCGAAAAESKVESCLKAETYPDGSEAWRICDDAIRLGGLAPTTTAKINLQIGEALYFAHRPGLALPYLDKALEADTSLDQGWRRRGWAYLMSDDSVKALADFTTWLALKPGDADALFAIAFLHKTTGAGCEQVMREYEAILAEHPDHYLTRFNLAGLYKCHDDNRARQIAEYSKIIAAGREKTAGIAYYSRQGHEDLDFYAMVRELRAETFLAMDRAAEAAEDVNWLIDNYPGHIKSFVVRSSLRLQQNDFAGALADAETLANMAPWHPQAMEAKVEALQRLGRHQDLITYVSGLFDGGFGLPNPQWLIFRRGVAYKQLGLRNEAIADFNQAMALDPIYVWSVYTQIEQSGYVFGQIAKHGIDPAPDFLSRPFANALEACMVDPECMK